MVRRGGGAVKLVILRLEFKLQDMWFGAYWDFQRWEPIQGVYVPWQLDIWICLLPTLPLHIRIIENVNIDLLGYGREAGR